MRFMPFRSIAALATFALGTALLAMAPFSYFRYTAVGFDTDQPTRQGVVHRSFRLRWPGNGSVRLEYAMKRYRPGEEDVDLLDLAVRILRKPPAEFREAADSWGFSCVRQQRGDRKSAAWIGVPSWLPALALLGFACVLEIRRRRLQTLAEPSRHHPDAPAA